MAQQRPTLLNSCARAATAAEARFRIDAPIAPARAARVIALDDGAVTIARRLAQQPWANARFLTCGTTDGELRDLDGRQVRLSDELAGVDVAVLLATARSASPSATGSASPPASGDASASVGAACTVRGIMTAGLVLGGGPEAMTAVRFLRPHARVLMVSSDEDDVADILTALRA